jgi:phosphopantothenoylcysteine decarboxylase/phosphopantothenate--cysteine ligase
MNVKMWNHPSVVGHKKALLARGVRFLGPDSGHLACGEVGDGRFAEPAEIAFQVESHFKNFGKWSGKKVLVTAGPTQEAIDPVRFISNESSGKMGYALAQAALNRGAEVTLVTGPTRIAAPSGVKVVPVLTAQSMHKAVLKSLPKSDIIVMAAAVADYRVLSPSRSKIKKTKRELSLRLTRNPDILGDILRRKRTSQKVVGFAAETQDVRKNAADKWKRKPCDLLVANRVGGRKGAFNSDENELLVFRRGDAKPMVLKRDFKSRLAERIMDMVGG